MYKRSGNHVEPSSWRKEALDYGLVAVVVLLATVFPRLMVLGGLPMTDEGIYAFNAQIIHGNLVAGRGLPDEGWLMIYPLLGSWVFEFATNPMIMLRLVDLLVATISSWFLCHVLHKESGDRAVGLLISLVFLFLMNQPLFIDCGFKNSMFAAFALLFLAMRLEQRAARGIRVEWGLVGALVAAAVMLRETFLYFLIIGAFAILTAYGWRACLRFTLGAAATCLVIILGIAIARGSVVSIVEAYHDAGVGFASVANQREQLFISNGVLAAREAAVGLLFGGMGIIAIVIGWFTNSRSTNIKRFAFWSSVTLVPLLEPAFKNGFPYHFSVCLLGFAGLTALGWKSAVAGKHSRTTWCLVACVSVIGVLLLSPKINYLVKFWPATHSALSSANTGTWPINAIVQTNYLLAADSIRKAAPPKGTLSVSGHMLALYPLTGLLPPSYGLSNLSALLVKLNLDPIRFRQALLANPPDVLMTTTRKDIPGSDIISKVVADSGMYEAVASIPVADKAYGAFGGVVYRRIVSHQ